MPLRMIDVYLPADAEEDIRESVARSEKWKIVGAWSTDLGDGRSIVKILVDVHEAEGITDHRAGGKRRTREKRP